MTPLEIIISILTAGAIILTGVLTAKFASELLKKFLRKPEIKNALHDLGYGDLMTDFLIMLLKYGIYFVTLLLALAQFGIGEVILQIISVSLVVLIIVIVAFSLKDLIPNAAAGLYLYKTQPLAKNDKIQIDGFSGTVMNIGLLSVIIKNPKGKTIIIPNSLIIKKQIIKK